MSFDWKSPAQGELRERGVASAIGWCVTHWRDVVYRVVVAVLLLAWLELYPRYLILVYSAERGFLSFDVIADGMGGLNTVLTWTGAMLLLFSFYQWAFVGLLLLRWRHGIKLRGYWWALAALGVAVSWGPLVYFAAQVPEFRWTLVTGLSTYSLVLFVSLLFFYAKSVSEALANWGAPAWLLTMSLVVPALGHSYTAEIIDLGMKQFRVGGLLPARTCFPSGVAEEKACVEGRLLLLGVRSIYLELGPPGNSELVVISNAENTQTHVGPEVHSQKP